MLQQLRLIESSMFNPSRVVDTQMHQYQQPAATAIGVEILWISGRWNLLSLKQNLSFTNRGARNFYALEELSQ
jgi:hypothetical protein